MVYFLTAPDLRWLVWKVLVDVEIESKLAVAIHALVGLDRQDKVEDVVWIREVGSHGRAEGELGEI